MRRGSHDERAWSDGSEEDDGTRNAGRAKLEALADRGHAVAPGVQRLQDARHGDGAKPVGIGLDHGEERRTCAFGERDRISAQRAQIDFDPGALLD